MSITYNPRLNIELSHNSFVSEIEDLDLSTSLVPYLLEDLKKTINHCGVVIFRKQTLKPLDLINFSRKLGLLYNPKVISPPFPDHPEIKVLSNIKKGDNYVGHDKAGHYWHTDRIYLRQVVKVSILYGVECPPIGGDTLFADTRRAYKELPSSLKKKIDGKLQVHEFALAYQRIYSNKIPLTKEQIAAKPSVKHPIVVTDPHSQEKAIYMSKTSTKRIGNLDENSSLRLLSEIENFCTQGKYIYRHKWNKGDVVLWNNLRSLHSATPFDDTYNRILLKTEILNEGPLDAA